MSTPRKIIVVSGAPGKQGGSIVCHLLGSKLPWTIRGLVKDPNSEEAKSLQQNGVGTFTVDFTKPASLEPALKGADTFFMLTDSFDLKQQGIEEYKTGVGLVDLAIKQGVKHLIFSTLPNVEKISDGKWDVPFFTNKAKIEEYIRSKKGSFETITFLSPGLYYQSFLDLGLVKNEGNEMVLRVPLNEDIFVPTVDIGDFGKVLVEVLKDMEKWNGKVIPIAGENLTMKDYARNISEALGIPTRLQGITLDQYRKEHEKDPNAKIWENMFGWFNNFGVFGGDQKYEDIFMARKIVGEKGLTTFKNWVQTNKTADPRWLKKTGPQAGM
eukprot:TRINITY_DN6041_c0_g1_i1.p1 TRINITY_DN6041_c0_g1~~TRINITY_DN6041_c0_g1_i1.p1  ORF type:complete len:326 (-),score=82.27 TRINITY_DN6041_c0_g1_i1:53-1030(-)